MQTFNLYRLQAVGDATRGELTGFNGGHISYTLEDAFHAQKIAGCTRIPAGRYPLGFHCSPKFDAVYSIRVERAGERYRGMIQINDVPEFEDILFHCGNAVTDTSGCILLGDSVRETADGFFIPSGFTWPAFLRAYPIVVQAIEKGGADLIVKDIP